MFRSTFTPFILPMPSNVSLNFPNSSSTVDGSVSTVRFLVHYVCRGPRIY
jgi:hypothetical protein